MSVDRNGDGAVVYTQTNDPAGDQVIAYGRAADGTLTPLGAFDTGGHGMGKPHLASQGSVVLNGDGRWLFAVNAGSDDLSPSAPTGWPWSTAPPRGRAADQRRRPPRPAVRPVDRWRG